MLDLVGMEGGRPRVDLVVEVMAPLEVIKVVSTLFTSESLRLEEFLEPFTEPCCYGIVGWHKAPPNILYTNGKGFLVYEFLLKDCRVVFPFMDFKMVVLNFLNVCLAQLLLNA